MKTFIYFPEKNLPIWTIGDDRALNTFTTANIFVIKAVRFQHSNFSKFDKMIYNSISDTCTVVFAPELPVKWYVFEQKHHSNSTKCPVNKLKAGALTASFSPCDIIENCVDILASILKGTKHVPNIFMSFDKYLFLEVINIVI